MFNFFKSVSKKSYIGVDIGTTAIKIAEVAGKKGEKADLINYGILEGKGGVSRVNDAIQTSSLKMLDRDVVQLIQILIKQLNIKTKDVVASVPSFSIFSTLLDLPMMTADETRQAIEYQARAVVPLPITEVRLDPHKVGEYEDDRGVKRQQIFLIAVPNDLVKKYESLFQAAGLNLKALEIEGLSLARIATSGDPTPSLLIDIGGRSTTLAIAASGLLKYNSQIDYAGATLTQAISAGLNINALRAEELKKQRGLMGTGGEYELSTLMSPYLDVIIGEAKRAKYNFEKDYKIRVERVLLSGGGANLKGIENYFNREFQLPVVRVNSLQRLNYRPELEPLAKDVGSAFAVSLGLAMREFI